MVTGKASSFSPFEHFSARFRLELTAGLDLFIALHEGYCFFGVKDSATQQIMGVGCCPVSLWVKHPLAQTPFKNKYWMVSSFGARVLPEPFAELKTEGNALFWCPSSGLWLEWSKAQTVSFSLDNSFQEVPHTAIFLESNKGTLSDKNDYIAIHFWGTGFEMVHYRNGKLHSFKQEECKSAHDAAYHGLQLVQSLKIAPNELDVQLYGFQLEELKSLLAAFLPSVSVFSTGKEMDLDLLIPDQSPIYYLLFQSELCV
ncbi:MAG: hypothetical protein ACJAY8_001233 [Sphingobacteriales bacterium]